MKNEEAVALMKNLVHNFDNYYCRLNERGKTAFRMAITSLKEKKRGKWIYLFDKNGKSEWGCLNCSHVVYTDDRTERPEDRGIYYCPHCCSDNREDNDDRRSMTMDDTIYRNDALSTLRDTLVDEEWAYAKPAIEALPSAQSETDGLDAIRRARRILWDKCKKYLVDHTSEFCPILYGKYQDEYTSMTDDVKAMSRAINIMEGMKDRGEI